MCQHSYVPFTGKPYIHYNGVNYGNKMGCGSAGQQHGQHGKHMWNHKQEHPYRTIVRSNIDDKKIINTVPVNGMGHVSQLVKDIDSRRCAIGDAWPEFVRKDNIWARYEKYSNHEARNLYDRRM
jgi:hypothetical protein